MRFARPRALSLQRHDHFFTKHQSYAVETCFFAIILMRSRQKCTQYYVFDHVFLLRFIFWCHFCHFGPPGLFWTLGCKFWEPPIDVQFAHVAPKPSPKHGFYRVETLGVNLLTSRRVLPFPLGPHRVRSHALDKSMLKFVTNLCLRDQM